MWLPTNIPYLIALSVLFFQWVCERDAAEREEAEQLAEWQDARQDTPARGAQVTSLPQ